MPVDSTVYSSESTAIVKEKIQTVDVSSAFFGWNTQANGSGTAYVAGDSMIMTGNVTLYAQWLIPESEIIRGKTLAGVVINLENYDPINNIPLTYEYVFSDTDFLYIDYNQNTSLKISDFVRLMSGPLYPNCVQEYKKDGITTGYETDFDVSSCQIEIYIKVTSDGTVLDEATICINKIP